MTSLRPMCLYCATEAARDVQRPGELTARRLGPAHAACAQSGTGAGGQTNRELASLPQAGARCTHAPTM
jgi:hypothetical protein